MTVPELGRRIVVWGATGSGKSTVARALSAALQLPLIELDALFWLADWQVPTEEAFAEELSSALQSVPSGWVIDGNYSRMWPAYLPDADAVVWLDLPFRVTFTRMLKRTAFGLLRREVLWDRCPQTWRQAWWLVSWSVTSQRKRDERTARNLGAIAAHPAVTLCRLRSAREVSAFLSGLTPIEPDAYLRATCQS